MKKHFLFIALICSIFVACGPKPELPTVTTNSVSDVTDTTALCVGAVVDNGNADIIAKGFCWGTEQNPTLENNTVAAIVTREEAADDFFTATLSGLTASTEYYVRAYAKTATEVGYGEAIKIKTPCTAIDDLPYIEEFNDVMDLLCWSQEASLYAFSIIEPSFFAESASSFIPIKRLLAS